MPSRSLLRLMVYLTNVIFGSNRFLFTRLLASSYYCRGTGMTLVALARSGHWQAKSKSCLHPVVHDLVTVDPMRAALPTCRSLSNHLTAMVNLNTFEFLTLTRENCTTDAGTMPALNSKTNPP